MTGWFYEAKKCLLQPFLIAAVLILLLINARMCLVQISRYHAAVTDQYLAAQEKVYNRVEGPITLSNMEWIISERERLNAVVQSGNFSTEYDPEGTYTGYIFDDNNLFNSIYEKARYAFEYESYAKEVAEKATENNELYANKQNGKLASWYACMANAFEGRKVTEFYCTDGFAEYFGYEFSDLAIMILVLIGVYPVYSRERELGMDTLIQLTPAGTRSTRRNKVILILVFAWFATTLFSVQDFLLFFGAFHFQGWENPLYSISEFQNTPLFVTIGEFFVINYLAKCLGVMVFASLVSVASAISPTDILALILSCVLFAAQVLLNAIIPTISFLPLLNCLKLCQNFKVVNFIFGSITVLDKQLIIQGVGGVCAFVLALW